MRHPNEDDVHCACYQATVLVDGIDLTQQPEHALLGFYTVDPGLEQPNSCEIGARDRLRALESGGSLCHVLGHGEGHLIGPNGGGSVQSG
jgi:hypothetical protein